MSRRAPALPAAMFVLSLAATLHADAFDERARLFAPDGLGGDLFGLGVAVDGDVVVVGTGGDDVGGQVDRGSAYVYLKPAGGWSGTPVAVARLFASDGLAGDLFGNRVAIEGDTIVVGAQSANGDRGAAYVFVKPAGGWSGTLNETARLVASDGLANDQLGASVGISGGVIVVGAAWDDNFQGSAYVFLRPGGGWAGTQTQSAKLLAADRNVGAGIGEAFGDTSSIDGDTIAVGALGEDGNGVDRGAAYVFVKPAAGWAGTLLSNAKLVASDAVNNYRFGAAVAVHGDTVVAGEPLDDTGTFADHGSAYVYTRPAAGWSGTRTQDAKLVASDEVAGAHLGTAVALDGQDVLVGAISAPGAQPGAGAVYRYAVPAAGWSGTLAETDKLTASDGESGDEFGCCLGLHGDTLVIGARRDDVGPALQQGSAYVFVRTASALALTPPTAVNPVGTSHTVTAHATSASGGPVVGVTVVFDVSGAVTISGTCVTAAGGSCDFTYAGPTAPGTDAIAAFADTDGDGAQDPGEPGGTASKTWVAGPPATLSLTPPQAQHPVGANHTVTAAAADAFGNPTPGVTVRFAVTGAVTTSGTCATSAAGDCAFTYAGPTAPGVDAIAAFADTDGDGGQDPGEPGAAAQATWVPGPPATLALTPPAAANPISTGHCVEAAVRDAFGNATPAITVRFTVTGMVNASGSQPTDAGGRAPFCYTGPDLPGTDQISAHADTNGDGDVDPGEPVGTATASWLPPASSPGRALGSGSVTAAGGQPLQFTFTARNNSGGFSAECTVTGTGVSISCLGVTTFRVVGNTVVVFGPAVINGVPTTYRIDARDAGWIGSPLNSFVIRTATGYSAGGPLVRGFVQVGDRP